ncbi:MAG: peptidoglycan-binding protein [Verrucomicrobiota bacterium]
MRATRNFTNTRFNQRNYVKSNVRSNATVHRTHTLRERSVATNSRLRATRNVGVNRERNLTTRRALRANNEVAVNRGDNFRKNRTRNIEVNRSRNVFVTNNWRGHRFAGHNYAAFRNYHRQWHNRGWWRNHYPRIVFITGNPWYWDSGYWYPAWGYNSYGYYPYDGPIYAGYADLTPDQVVVNVQQQLRRDGYYSGPIDGALGPMTRQAIAAFQADNGLAITSTIDQPTLSELGVS